jgi:hypothetical protein
MKVYFSISSLMVFVMYLRTFFSFLLVYFIFIRVTPAVVPKSDSPNANGDAYAFWNFQICFNSNNTTIQ